MPAALEFMPAEGGTGYVIQLTATGAVNHYWKDIAPNTYSSFTMEEAKEIKRLLDIYDSTCFDLTVWSIFQIKKLKKMMWFMLLPRKLSGSRQERIVAPVERLYKKKYTC
jgi:hypothetical protein